MNVFSSKVQYVEFSASNYRLTTRQIPLPPELVDVADDDLKKRITSRIRAPFDGIGKLDVTLDHGGKSETLKVVDDDWLKQGEKTNRGRVHFPDQKLWSGDTSIATERRSTRRQNASDRL